MTGSKFVPSIKNIVREICISSCEENILIGTMQSCSFSNPKGGVCECSGNTINSVNVKGYFQVRANLRISRDEISDEMDRIVELLNVRTECRYGYTHKK